MAFNAYASSTLEAAVLHACGKTAGLDTGNSINAVVNIALSHLANYSAWNWRMKALSLDFVISQSYIAAPEDFGELVVARGPSTSPSRRVTMTSLDQISRYRGTGGGSIYDIFLALSETAQASATVTPLRRFEIFPTPAANETGAIVGVYRKLIPTIATTSVADIPSQYQPPLLMLCRAFGKIMENDLPPEMVPEWNIAHTQLEQLKIRDGMAQPIAGKIRGTSQGTDYTAPMYFQGTATV